MANLRGQINSDSGRTRASRLAHREIYVSADTWLTFVSIYLNADGSGFVSVERKEPGSGTGRVRLRHAEWGAE